MEEKTTCIQCHTRISSSANFCENCGAKVSGTSKTDQHASTRKLLDNSVLPLSSNGNELGQKLIFIGLMIFCAVAFYYFLLGVVVDLTQNWGLYSSLEPMTLIVSFVGVGVPLLIAFGLKPGNLKTIAIIFGAMAALIHFYWFVDRLIPDEPGLDLLNF